MTMLTRRTALALGLALLLPAAAGAADKPASRSVYFPPAGEWARKTPAELGMDPAALAAAIQYAQTHETERALDFSDQDKTFGKRLG